ncbi:DUF7715 family protein [Aeromicrobium sp.]|uniref:DUF7715 family protein n=1 Tax=Aeromicrobium sp. TaxID=1871063 RepID=UPI003FA5F9C5
MKVLTATTLTNGERDNDFDWCTPGELVMFGAICDCDQLDPDNGCGCGRAFAGVHSHRATTTALIEDRAISEADLELAIRTSLEDGGWIGPWTSSEDAHSMIDEAIEMIRRTAECFPLGTVVGTRLGKVFERGRADAPH